MAESGDNLVNQERGQVRKKVDLDTLLVEEIGQFGPYQIRTLALAALVVIFIGWADTQYIFATARISTRCAIPECEPGSHQNFSPPWMQYAIPSSNSSSNLFDNCRRFSLSNSSIDGSNATCSASLFDRDRVVKCDSYVYENTNTVVYDFDLACDEWRRTIIGSFRKFGTLIAHPITGYISDRWGRRTAMAINAVNTAWLGVVRYWAGSYIGFTASQFIEAALGFGSFSCAYILAMELVGPKLRVAAGATISTFFAIGQVTLALIAWAVPNWRSLTLAIYIPQFITITYFWIMPESARWYMSKDLYDKSEKVLKAASRANGKELSEKSLIGLRRTFEDRNETEDKGKQQWLVKLVFQNKAILVRCLVSPVWWITAACVYYGLSINAVNLVGNQYLNYFAVAAVEIPGFWTAVLLLSTIGRKPALIIAYWVCGASLLGYILMPKGYYWVSLALYLIGKYSISTVMTAIHVYTAELYPTQHRHSLFAFSSMVGRIGSTLAPLAPALAASVWDGLPFVVFSSLAFLSGALVFVTPETKGCKLPDTMEEAARIGNTEKS